MTKHAQSDALHERARVFVRSFEEGRSMPESFDALAADLARFQAAAVPGYGRLCLAHGVDPSKVTRADQAPAVPAEAFRAARVFAFDERDVGVTFRTSGTTRGARGSHRMRHTRTYDAAALAFGRTFLVPHATERPSIVVLGPSPDEAPDSSLAHMYAAFARAWSAAPAPAAYSSWTASTGVDLSALAAWVARLPSSTPALVLSTSFALVHLLDGAARGRSWEADGGACVDGALALPSRSRVVQTGGFKGRSREVAPSMLRRALARLFAIEERAVVAEYGMTELSSQFWEAASVTANLAHGVYLEPPWARVVPVHPETLRPTAPGEVGLARIEDLANVDSAFAVLTQDRVRRHGPGFELLGRAPGAPPRGCSIAIDEMLTTGER